MVAQLPAGCGGRSAQLPDAAGDVGLDVIQHFGSLLLQAGAGRLGQAEAVRFGDGLGLGAGGAVGNGRPRSDHIQRVAQNVAEHDAVDPRRGAGQGEPPALDRRQPFADGVHLDDVCPAGQQLLGDVLQLPAGDEGLFKQGAAPARQQKEDGVRLFGSGHQVQRGLGGPEGIFVRHRVPRLIAGDAGQLPLHVAVFRHHHPGVHRAQGLHRRPGHLPGGFAGRHQQHPPGKMPALQRTADRLVGQDGGNGGADDGIRILTQLLIHTARLLFVTAGPLRSWF